MPSELRSFSDIPRSQSLSIEQDLAERVVGLVTERHPDAILGAEIQARITAETPTVEFAGGQPLETKVALGHTGAVAYAIELAVGRRQIVADSWGDQLVYRLPADPLESGHVTT